MTKKKCDICGKEFDLWDEQENFGIHHNVGYGSKYDGQKISIDMCCDCFDRMMDTYIAPHVINKNICVGVDLSTEE